MIAQSRNIISNDTYPAVSQNNTHAFNVSGVLGGFTSHNINANNHKENHFTQKSKENDDSPGEFLAFFSNAKQNKKNSKDFVLVVHETNNREKKIPYLQDTLLDELFHTDFQSYNELIYKHIKNTIHSNLLQEKEEGDRKRVPSFALLEKAKSSLEKQNINGAIDILKMGKVQFPEDKNIESLLNKISPRNKTQKLNVKGKNLEKEFSWLRNNSEKYKGKWVAVSGDKLVSSANTLSELLKIVKGLKEEGDAPLIHHIYTEIQPEQ